VELNQFKCPLEEREKRKTVKFVKMCSSSNIPFKRVISDLSGFIKVFTNNLREQSPFNSYIYRQLHHLLQHKQESSINSICKQKERLSTYYAVGTCYSQLSKLFLQVIPKNLLTKESSLSSSFLSSSSSSSSDKNGTVEDIPIPLHMDNGLDELQPPEYPEYFQPIYSLENIFWFSFDQISYDKDLPTISFINKKVNSRLIRK
jgi:hypothetical protein